MRFLHRPVQPGPAGRDLPEHAFEQCRVRSAPSISCPTAPPSTPCTASTPDTWGVVGHTGELGYVHPARHALGWPAGSSRPRALLHRPVRRGFLHGHLPARRLQQLHGARQGTCHLQRHHRGRGRHLRFKIERFPWLSKGQVNFRYDRDDDQLRRLPRRARYSLGSFGTLPDDPLPPGAPSRCTSCTPASTSSSSSASDSSSNRESNLVSRVDLARDWRITALRFLFLPCARLLDRGTKWVFSSAPDAPRVTRLAAPWLEGMSGNQDGVDRGSLHHRAGAVVSVASDGGEASAIRGCARRLRLRSAACSRGAHTPRAHSLISAFYPRPHPRASTISSASSPTRTGARGLLLQEGFRNGSRATPKPRRVSPSCSPNRWRTHGRWSGPGCAVRACADVGAPLHSAPPSRDSHGNQISN